MSVEDDMLMVRHERCQFRLSLEDECYGERSELECPRWSRWFGGCSICSARTLVRTQVMERLQFSAKLNCILKNRSREIYRLAFLGSSRTHGVKVTVHSFRRCRCVPA